MDTYSNFKNTGRDSIYHVENGQAEAHHVENRRL